MASFYGFMPAADGCNKKLGNVNYVYAPKENCSDACPFKDGHGCYGDNRPIKWVADKMTAGEHPRSVTWDQLISTLRRIARGDKVRMWVDGDFPRWHKGVDTQKAIELGNALHGKKAWAYTHHHPLKKRDVWAGIIRHYLERCFTINISCERQEHVDEYMSQGLPCVIAVPSTETRRQWRTPGGHRVRVCPNQIDKKIQCDRCMLCHKRPADMAIAFIAHGTSYKRADKAIQAAQAA